MYKRKEQTRDREMKRGSPQLAIKGDELLVGGGDKGHHRGWTRPGGELQGGARQGSEEAGRRTARPTGLGASGCARRLLQGRPSLVGREEKRTGSATRNPSSPLDSFGAGWGSSEETAEAGPNRFLEGRQVRQWVGISLINSG